MPDSATPGAKLKALRRERRLTLQDVAARTGLPVSTISKVENDKMTLNYDKVQALSTALGIQAGLLFKQEPPPPQEEACGRRSIAKVGEGRQVETHLTSYLYLASELLNKKFIPLITEVRARSMSAFGEMMHHPGEEFTYVLEGSLEIHSQLYAPLQLSAGESIYFDSGMPHVYIATSKGPCRILTICSSTEAHLFEAVDRSRPKRHHDEARGSPPRKLSPKKTSSSKVRGTPQPVAKSVPAKRRARIRSSGGE